MGARGVQGSLCATSGSAGQSSSNLSKQACDSGGSVPAWRKNIEHGRKHEPSALNKVERSLGSPVTAKKVYKDKNKKRVIPDGFVEYQGREVPVEVKNVCAKASEKGMNLREIAQSRQDKGTNWTLIPDSECRLRVNERSSAHKQVQKQMEVCDVTEAFLGVNFSESDALSEEKEFHLFKVEKRDDKDGAK